MTNTKIQEDIKRKNWTTEQWKESSERIDRLIYWITWLSPHNLWKAREALRVFAQEARQEGAKEEREKSESYWRDRERTRIALQILPALPMDEAESDYSWRKNLTEVISKALSQQTPEETECPHGACCKDDCLICQDPRFKKKEQTPEKKRVPKEALGVVYGQRFVNGEEKECRCHCHEDLLYNNCKLFPYQEHCIHCTPDSPKYC